MQDQTSPVAQTFVSSGDVQVLFTLDLSFSVVQWLKVKSLSNILYLCKQCLEVDLRQSNTVLDHQIPWSGLHLQWITTCCTAVQQPSPLPCA